MASNSRDKVSNQLSEYKKSQMHLNRLTTGTGAPIGEKTASLTVGPKGPILLQDFVFTDEMAHFNRERIPERVVHAKGAGAFGYFETTHDIRKYCKAALFQEIGKKTRLAVRFSTVGGESGSADTARDPRGFAVKFYTEDGNWDLVGNNTPIFFIRDPILDVDMFWDFITLRPETTHQVSFLFSDRGTPDGYRHMNGYGSHTFKMVNGFGDAVYCKFHFKTDQGIKNLMAEEADRLAGSNPDYAIQDLYNTIANGNFPSWTLYIQVMTFEEAENYHLNPFDLTKVWPHSDYPLIPVGQMVLDTNPKNYFAEVEQIAFSPAHMIPGIEPSPDKMLQGRLFSYSDTHRHRLGSNYLQIPVNCPFKARVSNYQRDGPQCVNDNQAGAPNYFPNSFSGPADHKRHTECPFKISGDVMRYNTADEDNFSQVGIFYKQIPRLVSAEMAIIRRRNISACYRNECLDGENELLSVLNQAERKRLVKNIANHLIGAQEFLQKRAVHNFGQADPEYGQTLQEELDKLKRKKGMPSNSVQANL